ncbi:MAG: DUF4783 domain-containing protein [Ignavibacteria bacterium]|nr:DUF4783 domain-containing protein [Ignavibacteria bacterium]
MKLLVFFLLAVYVLAAPAQQRQNQQRTTRKNSIVDPRALVPNAQQLDVRKLFGQIEDGLLKSSLAAAPVQFASQVSISIPGGESGYFSANQAASILDSYFSRRTPLSFQFTRYNDKGPSPFATGRLTFVNRGQRESVQIYISLVHQEARWVIRQFNIY